MKTGTWSYKYIPNGTFIEAARSQVMREKWFSLKYNISHDDSNRFWIWISRQYMHNWNTIDWLREFAIRCQSTLSCPYALYKMLFYCFMKSILKCNFMNKYIGMISHFQRIHILIGVKSFLHIQLHIKCIFVHQYRQNVPYHFMMQFGTMCNHCFQLGTLLAVYPDSNCYMLQKLYAANITRL